MSTETTSTLNPTMVSLFDKINRARGGERNVMMTNDEVAAGLKSVLADTRKDGLKTGILAGLKCKQAAATANQFLAAGGMDSMKLSLSFTPKHKIGMKSEGLKWNGDMAVSRNDRFQLTLSAMPERVRSFLAISADLEGWKPADIAGMMDRIIEFTDDKGENAFGRLEVWAAGWVKRQVNAYQDTLDAQTEVKRHAQKVANKKGDLATASTDRVREDAEDAIFQAADELIDSLLK